MLPPSLHRSEGRRLRLFLGLTLSLVFSLLAVRGARLEEIPASLGRIEYGPLLLACALVLLAVVVKALRWGLLFRPHHNLRTGGLFGTILIGQLINNLFPLRLGELARAYLIGEQESISKSYALGTIAIEKLMDSVMLLALLTFLVPLVPLPLWLQRSALTLGLGGLILLLLLWVVAYKRRELVARLGSALERVPGIERLSPALLLESLSLSLDLLREVRPLLGAWALSVAIWLMGALINQLVLVSLGIGLPFTASLLVLLLGYAGGTIPSAPGRIGVFHYLTILALAPFALENELALSYSLLLHLVVYVPPSLLALLYLWKENLSWARLRTVMNR